MELYTDGLDPIKTIMAESSLLDKPWRKFHEFNAEYRKYNVKDHNSGQTLKIRLCDTRGLEEEFTIDSQEISHILDGNFNPSAPFTTETFGFIRKPRLGDRIHCVAFVVDGSTIDVIPEKILKQMKAMQSQMNQRNIPQVIYLTKLDKVCPMVEEDAGHMFHSSEVHEAVDKIAEIMGLPRGFVLPIKNYESETILDHNIDILTLKALKQTADFSDDYIEEQVDKMAAEIGHRIKGIL
uniref:Interferon-induced protein 44-like protein n=1 Tax=Magallana gigas TaxID=29159 RepID=K1QZM8_MAGGI